MANEYDVHIEQVPGTPYGIEADDITSGKRKNLNTCQYWVKGLPAVCKYWTPGDPGECNYYETDPDTGDRIYPKNWNGSRCDFLGRRYECDKYESAGGEDLDKYICIATCPFRSGLYEEGENALDLKAVSQTDVRGYNADSNFVGRCDGCGLGKGQKGFNTGSCISGDFKRLPVICNYYKPWHMGFGGLTPKTTKGPPFKRDEDGRLVDEREELEERLPLSFKIYNIRSRLQKCAYWNKDVGSQFIYDTSGLYLEEEGEGEDINNICICPDEVATPYHTRDEINRPLGYTILENVWAESGSVICNGAKPECPCYTGKWIYCNDEKTEAGDKSSAHQVLELRFWMNDWASQDEYDAVFKKPPNKNDPSTSCIYTYKRWEKIGTTVEECILLGNEVCMCVPVPDHQFSSDIIQISEITYIKESTNAPTQHSFPSLVRNIEDLHIPPLYVIYPYSSKDPFDLELNPICEEQDSTPCIKRNNSIEADAISIVGWTVRNKTVYAFNATSVGYGGMQEIKDGFNTLEIETLKKQRNFNKKIEDFLEYLNKEESDSLYKASSNEDGLFTIGPVKLEYQKLNELIICFEFDNDWIFKKRSVWSQWHGGAVIQCDGVSKAFEHKYEKDTTYADDGYSVFTPPATAAGKLFPLQGFNKYELETKTKSLLNANSTEVYSSIASVHYNYSYCIKKISKKDIIVTRWKRVDNAGSLWIEIEDTNLCYIFDWGIDKAEVFIEDEDGNVLETVSMNKTFPTGAHSQTNIQSNACIISPSDNKKRAFFSSDGWKIKIDYWYCSMSNSDSTDENTEITFPNLDSSSNRFVSPNYDIALNDNNFSVSDMRKDTVAIMALFSDEDGRLISAMATKICVDVARTFCRDVEIYYSWMGDYQTYHLEPSSGFLRVSEDGPFRLESKDRTSLGSRAPCGDHELGLFSNTGPMWYPYDSCETADFYDLWTGANYCVFPHENTPRQDYRFVGPELFTAFCWPHATMWDCAEDWGCGHHALSTGSVRFTGYAKKRGYVNIEVYKAFGWDLPRFGNVLREYVERFKSIDNSYYLSLKGQTPVPKYAWMPLVMDSTCFYFDFNCFNQASGNDIFSFVNPLSFWLMSTDVSETIKSTERYNFDSVFDIRRTILASYPPPIIDKGSGYPFVAYYSFVNDSFQWAWQERWKDIERDIDKLGFKLSFVSIEKPSYIFDMYKKEHKFITDEGDYDFEFIAPALNDENQLETYPSIRLGAGKKRYFEIIYDNYDSSLVEWKDENIGAADGSGGSEDGNIYEKTSKGKWIHGVSEGNTYDEYRNMVYDSTAVDTAQAAENADRKIEISYDPVLQEGVEYVYNTGVIAKITKDRLKYLPHEETIIDSSSFSTVLNPTPTNSDGFPSVEIGNWCNKDSVYLSFNFSGKTFCVGKVIIKGYRGIVSVDDAKYFIHQPGITIEEKTSGGSWEKLYTQQAIYFTGAEKKLGIGVLSWEEEIEVELGPLRMITERASEFRIKFSIVSSTENCMSINVVSLYESKYIDQTESIKIWERKYNVSKGSSGDYNPDGINRVLSFEYNHDNSGVYFLEYISPGGGGVSAHNKMRRFHGGESKEDEEEISAYDYNSVIKAEEEQQKLYEEALGHESSNTTVYKSVLPPKVEEFLSEVKCTNSLSSLTTTMESDKTEWGNHWATSGYEVHSLWFPGGHCYKWNPKTTRTRCYLMGPFRDVMRYSFVHVHDNKEEAAAIAVVSWYAMKPAYLAAKYFKEDMLGSDINQKLGDGADLHNSPYQR